MQIFVYGTLKKGQCRDHILPSFKSKFIGETKTLPKYRLNHLRAFPGITHQENGTAIQGELWEINDECLLALDAIEGHPELFCRDLVELEDQQIAIAYFWQGEIKEDAGDCWDDQFKV